MRLFHILLFLFSEKSRELKQFWRAEITPNNRVNVFRLYVAHRCRTRHFLLCWRLANQMFLRGNKSQRRAARKISWALQVHYTSEIGLTASIGKKPQFVHMTGVVISDNVRIGDNTVIHQHVTIGLRENIPPVVAIIGDNVSIGAGACILGDVKIGNNVKIGAAALVLSDIPDNSTYICKIHPHIISNI